MGKTVEELQKEIERLWEKIDNEYRGPIIKDPPVRPYRTIVKDSEDPGYVNKFLIGTATTGLVRVEWVAGRYGQAIPPNWSMVQMNQFIDSYMPLRYQVDDAQNLIVKQFIEGDFEWLFLLEHDVILPPDGFRRLDWYMQEENVPIMSGLYYTRSRPAEPLVYRGRGVSFYSEWEFGDKVWCDGVPTGCLLIHGAILRAMWEESEEYIIQHPDGRRDVTRKVFNTPRKEWFDPEELKFHATVGTSDLEWCTRVMKGGFFEKAGWGEYKDWEYPFLVDTNIFCKHIDPDGTQYP